MDLDALANQFVAEDEQQMAMDEQLNVMAEEGQQVARGEQLNLVDDMPVHENIQIVMVRTFFFNTPPSHPSLLICLY